MAIWFFGKLDRKALVFSFGGSLQIHYNKCMARFVNTGAQNKANTEDVRCNQTIFVLKEGMKEKPYP